MACPYVWMTRGISSPRVGQRPMETPLNKMLFRAKRGILPWPLFLDVGPDSAGFLASFGMTGLSFDFCAPRAEWATVLNDGE